MAKKFRDLVGRTLSDAARASAKAETQAMLAEMNLRELRENLSTLSQDDVAKLLEVTQPYISKLERQSDMLVSKLFEYVSTLGGEVEIHATFPNAKTVVVNHFSELASAVLQRLHGSFATHTSVKAVGGSTDLDLDFVATEHRTKKQQRATVKSRRFTRNESTEGAHRSSQGAGKTGAIRAALRKSKSGSSTPGIAKSKVTKGGKASGAARR